MGLQHIADKIYDMTFHLLHIGRLWTVDKIHPVNYLHRKTRKSIITDQIQKELPFQAKLHGIEIRVRRSIAKTQMIYISFRFQKKE